MHSNTCRFCKGEVCLLYPANSQTTKILDIGDYACTNSEFGIHGDIVICQNCHLIYVDEKITQEQISTYYETANDPVYFSQQEARKITFLKYLSKLEKQYPKKGKLLDVGTNTGLFVKLAVDHHWKASGLEPNKWSVQYAKKHYGIDLVNKVFKPGVFSPKSFSVITMWDVIEHFTDPISQIKTVYDYLEKDGMFAFSTVDPKSLLAKVMGTKWSWYMEMHKVFFSRQCAKYYLEKMGFRKTVFSPHFRYLSLGYLSTRLKAINPHLSDFSVKAINRVGLSETIVPYYANDLYDCYAFK